MQNCPTKADVAASALSLAAYARELETLFTAHVQGSAPYTSVNCLCSFSAACAPVGRQTLRVHSVKHCFS
jgi:hypothetical protein